MEIFFKIVQTIIIIVFLFFVSDLRKKNKTKILLSPVLLTIMKVVYVIPLGLFFFAVITTENIFPKDWFALFLTMAGLFIVIAAKNTLGKNHSWTGYGAYTKSFSMTGIYSKIRHPMYLGIYLCILGMIVFSFEHLFFPLFILDILGSIYIIFILHTSSVRETKHLVELFGKSFERYCSNTPPYFPKFQKK